MASVTFSAAVGGNNSVVSDDNDPTTGLGNDGHRIRLVPALAQVVAVAGFVLTKATEAASAAASAALSYTSAAAQAVIAATSASAAAASAINAQGFASIAQAVSPDSPIRLNTRFVRNDFTVLSGYNACSAGPIEITENISVTISDDAHWSIV